jgi:hypothetical protein
MASLPQGIFAELPMLRVPISYLVDDPMPCLNPLYYHRKFFSDAKRPQTGSGRPLVRMIPADFLDRFCDVVQTARVRGKFSVVPNPFGLGEIDRGFRECPKRQALRFIRTVRSRLSPDFDITPEMITHGHALDLDTGRRLPDNEAVWSMRQNAATLTRYLAHAADILQRAGLEPNGFTSPWNFGAEVETAYAQAALHAQQHVNGRSLTWYFLAFSDRRRVMPRLMIVNRGAGEAVVHIVVGCSDYLWQTQDTARTDERYVREIADHFITADGRGRIPELVDSGSFVAILSHWQSLYSNGSEAGIAILDRVFRRVRRLLGRRIVWMKCSEMARYYAAAKSARVRPIDRGIRIASLFACPAFTISLPTLRRPSAVVVDGRRLRIIASPTGLRPATWAHAGGRTYVCFDLVDTSEIRLGA